MTWPYSVTHDCGYDDMPATHRYSGPTPLTRTLRDPGSTGLPATCEQACNRRHMYVIYMATTTVLAASGCRKDRWFPQVNISGRITAYSTQAARTGVSEGASFCNYISAVCQCIQLHIIIMPSALIVDVLNCLSC